MQLYAHPDPGTFAGTINRIYFFDLALDRVLRVPAFVAGAGADFGLLGDPKKLVMAGCYGTSASSDARLVVRDLD